MTRALLVLACALALPSAAVAAPGSGGGGLSGGGSTGTGTTAAAPVSTRPASEPVSVSDNGITLQTKSSALLRHQLSFTGAAPASEAGQTIQIEREGHATHGQWEPTVTATVAPDGSFTAVWHTTQVGRFAMRAVALSGSSTPAASATAAAVPSSLRVSVYRGARATIYGPGFYGRRTACGGRLRRTTLGVANRTLPCGTEVSIVFGGRELTVPVIDRGPYANGASWDLTSATATALGMTGTEWLGAIALPGRRQALPALSAPLALR